MSGLFHLCGKDRKDNLGGAGKIVAAEQGFTLVECLAAVTVFTILLGMVWGFYLFGVNKFQAAAERVDLQQNVRVAADMITRELRYARTLQLRSSADVAYRLPGDNTSYRIRQKNNEVVLLIAGTETKIAYNIQSLIFNWDAGKGILYFDLAGKSGRYNYTVNTALRLPNLMGE